MLRFLLNWVNFLTHLSPPIRSWAKNIHYLGQMSTCGWVEYRFTLACLVWPKEIYPGKHSSPKLNKIHSCWQQISVCYALRITEYCELEVAYKNLEVQALGEYPIQGSNTPPWHYEHYALTNWDHLRAKVNRHFYVKRY